MPMFPTYTQLVNSIIVGSVTVSGTQTPQDTLTIPSECLDVRSFLEVYNASTNQFNMARGTVANGILCDVSRVQGTVTTAQTQTSSGQVVLMASNQHNTNGSQTFTNYSQYRTAIIQLDVTNISGSGTLDVYLDTQTDGSTWINIAHFAQFSSVLGRRALMLVEQVTPSTSDFDATASLAAGSVRNGPWGSTLSIQWTIGGTGVYTFDVTAVFKA